jgi:hypothetical protein
MSAQCFRQAIRLEVAMIKSLHDPRPTALSLAMCIGVALGFSELDFAKAQEQGRPMVMGDVNACVCHGSNLALWHDPAPVLHKWAVIETEDIYAQEEHQTARILQLPIGPAATP